jgi:hypothetical protein
MLKINVNIYSGSEMIKKKVLLNPSQISEIIEPDTRPWFRSDIGDGDEIGAIIVMNNGNAYRTIDNIVDILKALKS